MLESVLGEFTSRKRRAELSSLCGLHILAADQQVRSTSDAESVARSNIYPVAFGETSQSLSSDDCSLPDGSSRCVISKSSRLCSTLIISCLQQRDNGLSSWWTRSIGQGGSSEYQNTCLVVDGWTQRYQLSVCECYEAALFKVKACEILLKDTK